MFEVNFNDYANLPVENLGTPAKQADDSIYSPKCNKEVKSYTTTVRILPNFTISGAEQKLSDVVKTVQSYYITELVGGETGYFVSPYTNKETCPFFKTVSQLTKSSNPHKKVAGEDLKKAGKTDYYAWVYIINDMTKPENNGKIKFMKFSKEIYKLMAKTVNPTEDEIQMGVEPINFWDLKNGSNLILSLKQKPVGDNMFTDYSSVKFAPARTAFSMSADIKDAAKSNIFNDKAMAAQFKTLVEDFVNKKYTVYKKGVKTEVSATERFQYHGWSDEEIAKVERILSHVSGTKVKLTENSAQADEPTKVVETPTKAVETPAVETVDEYDADNLPF